MRETSVDFVGSLHTSVDPIPAATYVRGAIGFDRVRQLPSSASTGALKEFMERADASGILVRVRVRVSDVVGSNTHRRLAAESLAALRCRIRSLGSSSSTAHMPLNAPVFTLAHSIAHFGLGGSTVSNVDPTAVPDHATERWCSRVAAEWLTPYRSSVRRSASPGRTVGAGVSKRMAQAGAASVLEGLTSYTEAFRLLGIRKLSTFDRLATKLVQR